MNLFVANADNHSNDTSIGSVLRNISLYESSVHFSSIALFNSLREKVINIDT